MRSTLLLSLLGFAVSAVAAEVPSPTFADVPYGPHPRQRLHFWKSPRADARHPAPLLFFVHGGGWQSGDRLKGLAEMLPSLLGAGVSVASVEYRLVADAVRGRVEPPVKAPMADAARALQLVRSRSADWFIDKARVAASGGSAGACTCLWLGFHGDLADPDAADPVARESTRPSVVAVSNAQTSLDPAQMREWIPNIRYGGHAFGIVAKGGKGRGSFDEFLAARERLLPWIREYSPYGLVTADDPRVYLFYKNPPAAPGTEKDPTHSATFGVRLKQRCDQAGVPCELSYPGAPDVKHADVKAFLLEWFRRSG